MDFLQCLCHGCLQRTVHGCHRWIFLLLASETLQKAIQQLMQREEVQAAMMEVTSGDIATKISKAAKHWRKQQQDEWLKHPALLLHQEQHALDQQLWLHHSPYNNKRGILKENGSSNVIYETIRIREIIQRFAFVEGQRETTNLFSKKKSKKRKHSPTNN